MAQDHVIYTDGRDVVVTDSTLKVRNNLYRLNGITKLSLWTIRPDRWPAVVLLLVGIAAAIFGYLGLFPSSMDMNLNQGVFSANTLALYAGAALALIGFFALILGRERYAVRIGTAEGEKNAVVSYKRDYIAQIVDALHSAFDMGHANTPIVIKK